MEVKKEIFRAYDIRGMYPSTLDEGVAETIGKALGTFLLRRPIPLKKVVVGRGNRLSSPQLSKAFIEGLVSTGCEVTDIGLSLAPTIYFYSCTEEFDVGAIITASHNPAQYNGIKLTYAGANKIFDRELLEIYEIAIGGDFEKGEGQMVENNLSENYMSFLHSKFSFSGSPKVVVACGNGTASEFAPQVFKNSGCEVVELNCKSDGSFPHGAPDPEKWEFLRELGGKVVETEAACGLGFDGDGDRLGFVDEKGDLYNMDKLLLLFARDLLKKHPGATVAYDVKCSEVVAREIKSYGGVPKMVRTGHPYLTAELKNPDTLLGAELSGHTYFGDDYFGFDDALYTGLRLVAILDKSDVPLSQLMAEFPKAYHTNEVAIPCADDEKFAVMADISRTVTDDLSVFDAVTVDGVRAKISDTGWFLVRVSNTSPKLTVRVEGKDEEEVGRLKAKVKVILENFELDTNPLMVSEVNYS